MTQLIHKLRLSIPGLSAASLSFVLSASSLAAASSGSEEQGSRPSTVVVIDAGHGGFDRGGIPGQRVAEKTMNLDVARRLKVILTAYGYRVVMTRDSDVFVPLPTRVAIANSYRNAIFVCIHFNSATRSGANGIETYFYSRESWPLASAIHVNVAGGAPSANRGVRRRGFYVLRKTTIPAVLVECGFLTNPSEAQYAQSSSYRQNLAEEIARGVRGRAFTSINAATASRVAANASVPLQPFIDQTRVHDPDLSRGRHSHRRSTRAKSSKKSSDSASDSSEKKSSSKKKKKSSGSEESHGTKAKSSQTED
ncbi:MAG: N-acetylmuramoyl-L-alanine amidase [Verrucomicrobiota bacterium]|jgi:N-acetylmuramoyl-L-alanine amidase